jgi:hypothetical protein
LVKKTGANRMTAPTILASWPIGRLNIVPSQL